MRESFSIKTGAGQVADEIRARIRRGDWPERLPGILRLSKEWGVSRSMMEAAFTALREAGDIAPAGERRAMKPVPRRSVTRNPGTLIIHDLPPETASGEAFRIIETIGAAMPPPLTIRRIPSRVSRAELLRHAAGVGARNVLIAAHGPENTDALLDSGYRVAALGTAGLGTRAPLISVDYEAMVRSAFRRSFKVGHTRVSMPLWRRKPGLVGRIRGWIAEEYSAAGLRHSPDFDAPVIADENPEAMREHLRAIMRHTPPTALIINNAMQWILVNSVLAAMRLTVPGEVSTILLEDLPELAVYTPSQAHFRHPAESFVRPILRALRGGKTKAAGGVTLLAPLWVSGDSLGPPRATGKR